ncbi:ubiquinone/menaquinone biosynthesis C-methylase UbiE [Nonomuraea polychroma]|uniref:Ubiquinone/menaquinone biosynthesis C-methylase UbiE n=1 Tax=Nonomuraea polychroma TaxID=46176 RepID=A0A438M6R6_9ACTN|nr:methyltransferase [Nonomuraea polychroma]RVX41388.1 ubiquinone/menaquinone biosynthesis C-methylase UbiE [Nonomuraea polychroma]
MTSYEPLLAHPWIARVDRTGTGGLVVTADPAALAVRHEPGRPPVLGDLVAEHLEHWGEVYDWTYRSGEGTHRADLDLSGWRATDTGEPLPADHMAEWADRTAELVLRHQPSRVLELGCGTGMLLHRLHPHLKAYVGTDIAGHVVTRLDGLGLPGVTVVRAAAHEINGAAVRTALATMGERPDCVLLNSVTQCFPSVDYLAAVLRDAIDLVVPGGTVIVGDVRHSGLLEEHYRTLEHPAAGAGPGQRAAADTELLFDPVTLAAVAAGANRHVTLSFFAKTLTGDTELTRYRFDAVLHVDPVVAPAVAVHVWDTMGPDPLAVLAGLARQGDPVKVVGIPNALLTPAPAAQSGAGLRAALHGTQAVVLLDPDDPMLLQAAVPAAAAATHPDALAGVGRPHEPLGAFARKRLTEVARRELRRAGLTVPEDLTAQVPSGAGRDVVSLARDAAGADRAGRVALTRMVPGAHEPVSDDMLAHLPASIRRFDEIALRALTGLVGGVVRPGAPRTVEQIIGALGVAPRHEWIVRRWLEVLRTEGLVRRDPDGRLETVASEPMGEDDGAGLDSACAALGYPEQMAIFFRTALARLPELLRDEIMAQALLFPDGDLLTSLSKDQNNVSNTYLNAAVGHVLARAAATRPTPLRVVELGAGAGGSTAAALDGLGDAEVDYLFTDVSRFFTMTAEERFGDRLRYALLDINADLVAQGAARAGADVVVAANVLHCARHAGRSLRWIRELLAPGGLVVVTEAIREHYLVLATMQFLLSPREGEPDLGVGDRRGGTGRVFFTGRELPAELAEAGLRPILELPGSGSPLAAPAQHLFVAARL